MSALKYTSFTDAQPIIVEEWAAAGARGRAGGGARARDVEKRNPLYIYTRRTKGIIKWENFPEADRVLGHTCDVARGVYD